MGESDQSMTEEAAIDSRASLGLSFDTPARLGRNALNTDRGTMSKLNAKAFLTDRCRHGQASARIPSSQGEKRRQN